MGYSKLMTLNLSHNSVKSITRSSEENIAIHNLKSFDLSCNHLQVVHPQGQCPVLLLSPRISDLQLRLHEYLIQLLQRISVSSFLFISSPGVFEPLSQCPAHSGPVRFPAAEPRQPGHVSQQPVRGLLLHV